MRLITKFRECLHLARGGAVEIDLKPYRRLLARIDEHSFEDVDEDHLKGKSAELAARARDGVALDVLTNQLVPAPHVHAFFLS